MRIQQRWFMCFVTLALASTGCGRDDPGPVAPPATQPEAAFIAVVENNDILSPELVAWYPMVKPVVDSVFSGVFGVPLDSLRPKTLNQIIEMYGEPWIIGKIERAARGHYRTITILTDATASSDRFLEALRQAKDAGRTLDVLFSLHASPTYVCFNGMDVPVDSLTGRIRSLGVKIRALYQTVCYGSSHLPSWNTTGIAAVCGARNENSLNLFAPAGFVEQWTSGKSFRDAVTACAQIEIDSLKKYDAIYGLGGMLLPTETQLYDSQQMVSGLNPDITFSRAFSKRGYRFASSMWTPDIMASERR